MIWLAWRIIRILIIVFIIINIVNMVLMGNFKVMISKKSKIPCFMVSKKNSIDMQTGNSCAGYSIAYILRHYDISADGDEIYRKLPNKMNDGCVYPKEVKRMLEKYGFNVKYCAGNLNALRNEVCKGNPVIVFIKVRKDKKWLHYVPVTGYDENNVYVAESLTELVNCSGKKYNRKISCEDFKVLWNTSMLKMPLYTHTFYSVEKK